MLLLAAAAALLSGEVHADEDTGLTLGLAGGWFWYDQDDNLGNTWTVVPRVGYQLNRTFTLEADLGLMQGLTELDRSYNAFTPRLNLLFHPFHAWPVQPFLAAGPGLLYRNIPNWDFEDPQGGVSTGDRNFQNPDLDLLLNLGPGLKVPLLSRLSLRTDLRFAPNFGINEAYSTESSASANRNLFTDWEWTVGLMFHPGERAPEDRDGDGLIDDSDACPDEAEDRDDWQDEDGCPDPDNDEDGVLDDDDSCRDDPEDEDGWEDEDGCPDPDNDKDGFADADDSCRDVYGHPTAAGCPDRDGDKVLDEKDSCPDEYGEGADGCPTQVVVDQEKQQIVILDKVYFDTDSDVIQQRSYGLLDEVARVMEKYPELKRVEVSGHTDSVGNREYNVNLSQRRAESVKTYLVGKGVDASRLTAAGYGPDKPIASNDNEEGRSQNRRVEFNILEQTGEERVRTR